jgi:N-acetyl-alpha-D-muramate 1-phosphate uridylyltransferase
MQVLILCGGRGTRLNGERPKPLIEIGGRPMIDWALGALRRAGVEKVVVNTHHLADQMVRHLGRYGDWIEISDESEELLESGGGVVKALPRLGREAFFLLNADSLWIDEESPELQRLALAWRNEEMDILLMLAPLDMATGHSGKADFVMDGEGRLARAPDPANGHVYAGAAILHPRLFEGVKAAPHSVNVHFDRAIAAGRLYGMVMEGAWFTVGTPSAIGEVVGALARLRHPVS